MGLIALDPLAVDGRWRLAHGTSAMTHLGTVEVFSAPIPLVDYARDGKDLQACVDALCVQVELIGDNVGATDGTLKFYRCPELDADHRDSAPFHTKTIVSSGGTVQGADLITNGAFATDTGWTKESGWTISGGRLNYTDSGSSFFTSAYQSVTIAAAGDDMLLTFDVPASFSTSQFRIMLGDPMTGQLVRNVASIPTGLASTNNRTAFKALTAGAQQFSFVSLPKAGVPNTPGIDNVVLKKSPWYRDTELITTGANKSDAGPGVVVGFLPAADMAGTYLTMRIRRYGGY